MDLLCSPQGDTRTYIIVAVWSSELPHPLSSRSGEMFVVHNFFRFCFLLSLFVALFLTALVTAHVSLRASTTLPQWMCAVLANTSAHTHTYTHTHARTHTHTHTHTRTHARTHTHMHLFSIISIFYLLHIHSFPSPSILSPSLPVLFSVSSWCTSTLPHWCGWREWHCLCWLLLARTPPSISSPRWNGLPLDHSQHGVRLGNSLTELCVFVDKLCVWSDWRCTLYLLRMGILYTVYTTEHL